MPHTSLNFRHKDGPEVPLIKVYKLPIAKPVALPQPRAVEDVVVPIELYRYHNEDLKTGIGIALGAIALIGLVAGASLLAKNSEVRFQTRVSSEAQTSLAEKATLARAEIVAKAEALADSKAKVVSQQIADHLNANIEGDSSRIAARLLNGAILKKVTDANGNTEYVRFVQGAILLSTLNDQAPDADGKFLIGARLGMLSPKGTFAKKLTVKEFIFDPSTMKAQLGFTPVIQATIITTATNVVGKGIEYSTTANDPVTNEQLQYDYDYVNKVAISPIPIYVGEEVTS